MIIDYLDNRKTYEEAHPRFKKAFDGLSELIEKDVPEGTYEIDGKDIYAIVSEYGTVAPEEKLFEAHRKYIDIQLVMSGFEECHAAGIADGDVTDKYDSEKDCEFFAEPEIYDIIPMECGKFAIFYPQDIHRPGISATDIPSGVKKMVVKILL